MDILVNNAAGAFTPTAIADVTEEDYDRLMAVNTKAVFTATRYAARNMRDGGRIVTISTLNTILPVAGCSLYCASKGAVEQLAAVRRTN